jgi:antitoxin (DNA-binding transcriptional repressor) of toxin-antitoxin stability system
MYMLREISLSDARKNLSALLREIEADPEAGYRILVRKRAVAELRSPAPARRKNAGAAMLKLAREMERLAPRAEGEAGRATAARYKEYLYGNKSVASAGRRR